MNAEIEALTNLLGTDAEALDEIAQLVSESKNMTNVQKAAIMMTIDSSTLHIRRLTKAVRNEIELTRVR